MKKRTLKKTAAVVEAMAMLVSGITACAEETYTTKTGDDLSKIAKMIYGDALKWREIYERNKEQIKDPNVIYANQTLIIPDTATAQVNTDTTAQDNENTVTVDTSIIHSNWIYILPAM